ncbi:Na+/H+ antiporter subunit D [Propioniciclava coleopterorum]|uniref:Na+/H+ antiporter subunit D n=1 Tax=Propioniciclava coleopterorum TaxID=2714937 RepID=A0A6G7Y2Z0_9ACTN|nr:Na+/H+ antiporter subunit D [Propioniciclava coleopterorum]QIK71143.1 Na+/H+ antiporter subunit D [Propioniciclava coleopterorum]
MNNLLPVPVLLPMLGAALALMLGRRPRAQRLVSILVLAGVVGVAGTLALQANAFGPQTLWVGAWPQGFGIVLVADRLSALMLTVAALVTLAVLLYSAGQEDDEVKRETPVSIFHPTFLLMCAGVSDAFLAGDLFNLFVGFEILLFASYVLLTMGGTGSRIRAGSIYVVVNLVSSSLFLIALANVYAAVGTVNLAQIAQRVPDLPEGTQALLQFMLLIVFAIKAAVFPLSAWLPDSYPTAPAPVTAVFAGLLTKVGVYAILRTQTLIFPHRPLTELLLVVAAATMIVGILGAIAQSEIKRMLSFTLVSHIGYMIMGIGLATQAGLAGAIFYTAHHITIQATLFLVVGLIQRVGGSNSLDRLSGLLITSPLLAVLFIVPGMNLAGIPPLSGFIGKLGLLSAGVQVGTPLAWFLVATSVVTSLLTLYCIAKVWNRAFWGTPVAYSKAVADEDEEEPLGRSEGPMPPIMVAATCGLIGLSLLLTVFAGPLYQYATEAAGSLLDGAYVQAVLGEATP